MDFNDLPLSGWFPGHMIKAGRRIQETLKLIDLVVELVDARAPESTRNPAFTSLLRGKPTALVANKTDLADPERSRLWKDHFRRIGERAVFLDSTSAGETDSLLDFWRRIVEEERHSRGATRPLTRPIRLMIAGIPNVGKSTLVNRLSAGRKANVGPKPGVTRDNQWISLPNRMELLDTPGVLWPRIRDKIHELRLAVLGSIRDEVMDIELMAEYLWWELRRQEENAAWSLYHLDACPEHPHELLDAVARRRGLLRSGGQFDAVRAATALVKDFREARLGRLTLECPTPSDGQASPEQKQS